MCSTRLNVEWVSERDTIFIFRIVWLHSSLNYRDISAKIIAYVRLEIFLENFDHCHSCLVVQDAERWLHRRDEGIISFLC